MEKIIFKIHILLGMKDASKMMRKIIWNWLYGAVVFLLFSWLKPPEGMIDNVEAVSTQKTGYIFNENNEVVETRNKSDEIND